MPGTMRQRVEAAEVEDVHDRVQPEVNNVHRHVDLALEPAKRRTGAAIRRALEGRQVKEFGSRSLISDVCSGEKVPDYLARMVGDRTVCRRLAMALLEDDPDIVVMTTPRRILQPDR